MNWLRSKWFAFKVRMGWAEYLSFEEVVVETVKNDCSISENIEQNNALMRHLGHREVKDDSSARS